MTTILISGASGIVGYGILRSLGQTNKPLRLIGSSIYTDSVAPAFCDVFEVAPATDSPNYLDWLINIITKHDVDLIIPGIEADMFAWAENIFEIERCGAKALLNNIDLIKICKDKWSFYKKLKGAGLECAIESSLSDNFNDLSEKFGVPFLLKPRQGFGSKGIVKPDSMDSFSVFKSDMGSFLMAQPIVGSDDEEYTTSAFCDGLGGFSALMTLKRQLSISGFTEKAVVVDSSDFLEVISDLCMEFMPLGPTNFQFRRCRDGFKLLEINPRISSSTSIRVAFGYNESEMAVNYFLNNQMPAQPKIRQGKAVRYTDEKIFYENRNNI